MQRAEKQTGLFFDLFIQYNPVKNRVAVKNSTVHFFLNVTRSESSRRQTTITQPNGLLQ
jgi:hypothetical protein